MKKMLILIGAVVLVLAVGTAFAAEKEMSWGLSNGVTVFETFPAPTKVAGPDLALANGATIFEPIISASAEEYGYHGSAAGGMAAEDLSNGVTVFNPEIGALTD